jgi:hypothetical protein
MPTGTALSLPLPLPLLLMLLRAPLGHLTACSCATLQTMAPILQPLHASATAHHHHATVACA